MVGNYRLSLFPWLMHRLRVLVRGLCKSQAALLCATTGSIAHCGMLRLDRGPMQFLVSYCQQKDGDVDVVRQNTKSLDLTGPLVLVMNGGPLHRTGRTERVEPNLFAWGLSTT